MATAALPTHSEQHSFSLAALRDHGMASEYEPHVIMNRTPSPYEIEGGIPFDKNEAVPVFHKPKPRAKTSSLLDTDPALCLTPEKPPKQSSGKVRFDQTVQVRQISPETKSPPVRSLRIASLDSSASPLTINAKDCLSDSTDEPISITARDLSHLRLSDAEDDDEVSTIMLASDVPDSVLARPEFNTLLLVNEEHRKLQALEPNVIQAAQKKLEESEHVKTKVGSKVNFAHLHLIIKVMNICTQVSTKLNCASPQFEAVIPLEVNKDDIVTGINQKIKKKDLPSSGKPRPEV
jgi:hypothetical protein